MWLGDRELLLRREHRRNPILATLRTETPPQFYLPPSVLREEESEQQFPAMLTPLLRSVPQSRDVRSPTYLVVAGVHTLLGTR